jgi:hypothetical protein
MKILLVIFACTAATPIPSSSSVTDVLYRFLQFDFSAQTLRPDEEVTELDPTVFNQNEQTLLADLASQPQESFQSVAATVMNRFFYELANATDMAFPSSHPDYQNCLAVSITELQNTLMRILAPSNFLI